MIPINEAVTIAQSNLQKLIPQAQYVLLEEVELNENEWNITLSFPDSTSFMPTGFNSPRKYKLLIIDAGSGVFKAMKIRNA